MNFKIGDINGKKATIIRVGGKILFSSEDEDCEEYDWDEVFQKQFIPFIKQITGGGSKGCATTADEDDENEDVDYDELPFTIYK